MTIIDPIQEIVFNFLSNFAYQDAIFLSERLHSESNSEESLYLLALSHYRAHKTLRAYHLLKNRYLTLPQSKYLLAKCCLDLNKYGEAEAILTECTLSKQKLYDEILKEYGDYSCFVLQILAHVYSKTDRMPQAVDFHKKSLRLNPFLWSSFEALCNFGEKIDPNKYFTLTSALNAYNAQMSLLEGHERHHDMARLITGSSSNKAAFLQQNFCAAELFAHKENSTTELNEDVCNCSALSANASIMSSKSFCGGSVTKQQQLTTPLLSNAANQMDTSTTSTNATANTSIQLEGIKNALNDTAASVATPPQLISAALNQAPPPKKCISKRLPVKPLSGQNTGNLANIALSSHHAVHNLPQTTTVRRSSRIFAQNVKENKKVPSSSSSGSSTAASTSAGTTSTSSSSTSSTTNEGTKHQISSKRPKIKKKLNTSLAAANTSSSTCSSLSMSNSCLTNSTIENSNLKASASFSNLTLDTDIKMESKEMAELGSINCATMKIFSRNQNMNDEAQRNKLDNMMKLFREIGYALVNLSQYECQKALDYFEQLPPAHYQSSYVLSAVGKALFELHNYQKAEKVYQELRHLHPYHLEGLEYYSTVLWHLQKEIALSSLAQELTEYDKLAPETWCVVGNCFSLHKEHDAAIKFFQRATQINPNFVYAYNLLGHEYFLIEEMEKGLSCFRKAIFLDPRHYNAWYGISMINLKQEKFLLAESYLKKALLINPNSSTLMCHIAVVYHSMKKSEKALEILDRALEIEPKNFLCKFHRASILFSMEKYELALKDFEKLRRQIPKESLIYYMISKTHKKLKNIHLSLMYMSWAMDLDPKGVNNQLKESIDKRYVVDNDSTFARELEATNTSTLDAIYGYETENSDNTSTYVNNNNNNGANVNTTNYTFDTTPPYNNDAAIMDENGNEPVEDDDDINNNTSSANNELSLNNNNNNNNMNAIGNNGNGNNASSENNDANNMSHSNNDMNNDNNEMNSDYNIDETADTDVDELSHESLSSVNRYSHIISMEHLSSKPLKAADLSAITPSTSSNTHGFNLGSIDKKSSTLIKHADETVDDDIDEQNQSSSMINSTSQMQDQLMDSIDD